MIRRRNPLVRLTLAVALSSATLLPALADGPSVAPIRRAAPRPVVQDLPPPMVQAPVSVLRVDLTSGGAQSLAIPRGKSAIIELPVDVRDLMVTNPAVAEAVVRSPRRISVLGVANGQTDAVFFDAAGRRILTLDIRVDQDVIALGETIRRVLPGSQVRVEPVNDGVILSGMVMNAVDADRAVQIAQRFVAKPESVLNMLSIAGKDQVMLKVRIVEVQRNVIKQLGLNASAVLGQLGGTQYSFSNTPSFAVNGGLLGGGGGGYSTDTTSAPISTLANALGILPGGNASTVILPFVQRFLSGDTSLTTAQNSFLSNLLSNTAARTTAVITAGNVSTTYTQADVGISNSDLAQAVRNFQSGTGGGTGNDPRNLWLSNFVTNLNAASNTPQNGGAQVVDWGNPAAQVRNNLAGSNGLNKANAMIQAFERVGLVRTLAEPNLTVVSGEAGKFLVGGEFPVPVGQDDTGKVTLEFKPYGIGLGYTPVVLSGGRIALKLSTEVSELSSLGAFSLSNGAGSSSLVVPGLTVRRVESSVELPSGGSLMIAGLLQQQSKQNIDALPGMTALPVLGSLFRSRDYQNGETELVVIITPYIVDAQDPGRLQTPADGLRVASDPETVLLGRLNTVVKAARNGPEASRPYQGPIGYVIE